MVLRGVGKERGAQSMSTSPKRSNRLHNFSFPFLKWGSQRHLRCTNAAHGDAGAGASASSGDRLSPGSNSDESTATRNQQRGSKRRLVVSDDDEGIAVMREKLMLDLKTAANKMKDSILRNEEEKEEEREAEPETVRPWNLRTRRAECKAPVAPAAGQKHRDCSSPARTDCAVRLSRLRRNSNSDKTERVKFSVPLSRKEVEEDFMAMVGHPPPRRPNKRPKVVQKQLDMLFPGLWLTEVTADMYKVLDPNENGKGRYSAKGKGKGKDVMLLLSDSDE